MKTWILFLHIFLHCSLTFSASILVLHVHDERSHLFSMAPFLKRLSDDGHNLTIFDSGSHSTPAQLDFNSTMIYTSLSPNTEFEEGLSKLWNMDAHSAVTAYVHKIADDNMGRLILVSAESFIEIFKTNYDLIIVDEIFSIHGMTITKILNALNGIPYIIFTTANCEMEANLAEFALSHTPVIDATMGTPVPIGRGDFYDPKRFSLRLINVLQTMGEFFVLNVYNPLIVTYKSPSKLMPYPFSTHEIIRNMDMQMKEGLDRLGRIVPQAVDFRGIGSHCKAIPELPADFKEFVEDRNSKGTIYIAFGSVVNFDQCPQFIFDAIFEALNKFPKYKVIFSIKTLKSRKLPKLNANVKLLNWAPQLAILGHEKTKLFMSHGGLKSFKEAICTKTPMVFLPIIAEQGTIARLSMKMNIGTSLNKFTINSVKIVEAFNLILNDESYKQNIEKFYDYFLDRIIPSLDEGAWLVNKIIGRNQKLGKRALPNSERSSLFFRRKGIYLNYINYFGFDWILVFAIVIYCMSKL